MVLLAQGFGNVFTILFCLGLSRHSETPQGARESPFTKSKPQKNVTASLRAPVGGERIPLYEVQTAKQRYPVIPRPRRGRENPLLRSPNRKKAVMLRHARSARLSMTIEKRARCPIPCLNKRAKSRLFSRLFSRHSVPTLWLEAISQAAFLK